MIGMIHKEAATDQLLQRIEQRTAVIGVIGLGYVGLPLAVEFARAGFRVVGFDVDAARVASLNQGICHIADVDKAVFQQVLATNFQATGDFGLLAEVDAVTICVPTPLGKNKEPDVSYVMNAAVQIARHLHRGQLVVLESTTFPGTTEELLLPLFERRGLHAGIDYGLAFSPERIDPGNQHYTLRDTPKVVGGMTEQCALLATALYRPVVSEVVQVSSPKAAELVKLLENTFRSVNIGLANEFAQMADILDINIWEVIQAASTKPYGFMPFYPGPGLGGHCIPIDPLYLSWKLRSLHYRARFIELASEINEEMPEFVVDMVARALNEHGKCLNGARILALGVAYKRDISDMRESPALDVMKLLLKRHARVEYVDQYVPTLPLHDINLRSKTLNGEELQAADCVVILTNHSGVDYAQVVQEARLVIDTRNATGDLPEAAHVWRLTRPRAAEYEPGQQERGAA
jgi:UDP-N-acetyl-D-glucosamine dehydrogenase